MIQKISIKSKSGSKIFSTNISQINPQAKNEDLVEFGRLLTSFTDSVYESTDRIITLNADTEEPIKPDYSGYLVVDSPFTEDLTDECGNTWTTTGNPVIQEGKLYFDGASYLTLPSLTLGGQDFTFRFKLTVQSSTVSWGHVLDLINSEEGNCFSLHKHANNPQLRISVGMGMFSAAEDIRVNFTSRFTNLLDSEVDFTLVYRHADANLLVYYSTALMAFKEVTSTRITGGNLYLGGMPNEPFMKGYISDFKIYDGVAIVP